MTSKELLYVKTVADEKNISRAAKKLFMAQPSLSQSIQRIEESVGTPLFNRTSSGLTLTFAGERYYHMATQVLKMFEDFELEFSLTKLKPKELSTGQAQRIGLIRALLLRPKLLILDEITAPLDLSASGKILSHLLAIQKKQNISYIFISHETGLFKPHCAQILQMNFLQNQA